MPDLDHMIKEIVKPEFGAVSIFQGITRDNFDGKQVTYLGYECYEKMAVKEMTNISLEAMNKFEIGGVSMAHRIGEVPVS